MDFTVAQMLDGLMKVGIFVFLVEAVTQAITVPFTRKWEKTPAWFDQGIALAVGIVSCLLFDVNVFEAVGFKTGYPHVARIFTGFIVSRGSNYWHDLTLKAAPKPGP